MIDTIVITLNKDMFRLSSPDKFKPSAKWAMDSAIKNSRIISKQNPTQKELAMGIYKPKLTLARRSHPLGGISTQLRIELSLPKLYFGNNFNELRFKDFKPLLKKLAATLEQMGINTTEQELAQAPINAIHYSKNIKLTDGSTPYHYIQKLKEANMRLSLDVNQTDYRNEGHSYKWHSNYYEIVFYDKILDLEKAKMSSKRAFEKDNALQVHLLNTFKKRWKLEILRMEVRLNRREKIKRLFKKLNVKADLTFQRLFKPAISKKILLYYLDELESKRPLLLDYKPANGKALLAALIFNNPDLGQNQILRLYGLKQAFDIMNPRELRMMLGSCKKRRSAKRDALKTTSSAGPAIRSLPSSNAGINAGWSRIINDAAKVKLPVAHSPLRILKEQLMKFEMIQVV